MSHDYKTRRPRISYEDYKSDSDYDDYGHRIRVKRPPKPASPRTSEDPEWGTSSSSKAPRTRRSQVQPERPRAIRPLPLPTRISRDSPAARLTPMGTPCELYSYDDIPGMILHPDKYFPHGVTGVNVILPEYDLNEIDRLRYFGIDSHIPSVDFSELIHMSEKERSDLRARCEESLEQCKTELVENPRIVVPFDVDSEDIIAIKCDVRTFDWDDLGNVAQFDVIVMDPPWKIQSPNGCRCLELRYELLPFDYIAAMKIPAIQKDGFLFLWVVVSMFDRATTMLADWGYRIVTDINWVKCSRKGKY
jgi:hypothetical protein